MSPTQRTLQKLKKQTVIPLYQVVEVWNPFSKTRRDLYGFIDILCVDNGVTIGIQVTSRGNMSARKKKIEQEHAASLQLLKNAGWVIQIIGWAKSKKTKKWEDKIISL